MSLVGTLAKVAVGVALAKGVSTMAKGASTGASRAPQNPGSGSVFGGPNSPGGGSLQDMLGGMLGGGAGGASGGGLGDLLGGLAGGGTAAQRGGSGGGLGDLLGQLGAGGAAPGGGGIGDLLGQMLGGAGAAAGGAAAGGGLGGLLEGLSKASRPDEVSAKRPNEGSLGDLLNQSLQRGEPKQTPTKAQEDEAGLLLRAMIQAAKSDGRVDQAEKDALLKSMGDMTREEVDFVQSEFAKPVDPQALARDVPRGMEQQVYAMSLLGLDLDSQAEAEYLHTLGQALGIEPKLANAIHEKMGEPPLYR